jgi:hypothetical protein
VQRGMRERNAGLSLEQRIEFRIGITHPQRSEVRTASVNPSFDAAIAA